MSAFMVPDEVYAELGRFLRDQRPDLLEVTHAELALTPQSFVECLRTINRASIIARYPSEATKPWMLEGEVPGKERVWAPIDLAAAYQIKPVEAAKHLHCIAYQSCETDRWEAIGPFVETLAEQICHLTKGYRGEVCTPGYEAAPWGSPVARVETAPSPAPLALALAPPAPAEKLTSLDVAEVAKRVRAEIKSRQKAGTMPKGKISVTCDRFSGGRSLSVSVVDVDAKLYDTERLAIEVAYPKSFYSRPEWDDHWLATYTDEGKRVLAAIKEIVDVYHRDDSDTSTDYFNCNFYRHEAISEDQRKKERAALAAQAGKVAAA